MLENLPDPAPSAADRRRFVATLWGVLSANVFWLPMGARITRTSELQAAQMELLVEGITQIQAGPARAPSGRSCPRSCRRVSAREAA